MKQFLPFLSCIATAKHSSPEIISDNELYKIRKLYLLIYHSSLLHLLYQLPKAELNLSLCVLGIVLGFRFINVPE